MPKKQTGHLRGVRLGGCAPRPHSGTRSDSVPPLFARGRSTPAGRSSGSWFASPTESLLRSADDLQPDGLVGASEVAEVGLPVPIAPRSAPTSLAPEGAALVGVARGVDERGGPHGPVWPLLDGGAESATTTVVSRAARAVPAARAASDALLAHSSWLRPPPLPFFPRFLDLGTQHH
jgi:hypothetical protein